MKLLLHVCCAPCSTKYIEALREEGLEPTLFWYNPNIHPVTEYCSRRGAMIGYAEEIGTGLLLQDHYGLQISPRYAGGISYAGYQQRLNRHI